MKSIFIFLIYINIPLSYAKFTPKNNLSETGLYSNIQRKIIYAQNMEYSPQHPLWSDGALNRHWIYLPAGQKINSKNMDQWKFPIGTKLWKNFVHKEAGKLQIIETRFMQKHSKREWFFGTYVWNKEQTKATLVSKEGIKNHYFIKKLNVTHDIPSKGQCITCHDRGRNISKVKGFSALNLSDLRDPNAIHGGPQGPNLVTLNTLKRQNLLTHYPVYPPRIFESWANPLQRRVLGYLYGNCSSCHNSSSRGLLKKIDMGYHHKDDISVLSNSIHDNLMNKKTWRTKIPGISPIKTYRMKPNDIKSSAVIFHMENQGKHRRQSLATKVIDKDAIGIIKRYIQNYQNEPRSIYPEGRGQTRIKLYYIDCGDMWIKSQFFLTGNLKDILKSFDLKLTCVLIKHPKGNLLWGTGIMEEVAKMPKGKKVDFGARIYRLKTPLLTSLKKIGITPKNLTYISNSHMHEEHAGNNNQFLTSTFLIQKEEYWAAFQKKNPKKMYMNPETYNKMNKNKIKILQGDYDVFGDKSVIIKKTKGHTPGHQSLFVDLPKYGPILLSGDIWHVKRFRDENIINISDFDKKQVKKSRKKIERFIKQTRAEIWFTHDPDQFKTIKHSPKYYE